MHANKWENENTVLKTKKIKLYPTHKQRNLIRTWFDTYRYVYNKSIDSIKRGDTNKFKLKNKHVTFKNNTSINTWELQTPKAIRQQAVYDASKAFKTCMSQLKSGLVSHFKLGFKSKKQKKTSIGIENCKTLGFKKLNDERFVLHMFPTFIEDIKIGKRQQKEVKNLKIDKDCRLSFDGYSLWLCIPVVAEKQRGKDNCDTIALDPGTRTFMTGYDPNGKILKLHRNDDLFQKLKKRIGMMQSLRDRHLIKNKCLTKYQRKLKNSIDDFQWQSIRTLTKDYKHVLLPTFESQELKKKSTNRHLNRELDLCKHYMFKLRLNYKAQITDTYIYDVDESFTTITCSNCGVINMIGSDIVYRCASCNVSIERDENGSRNIFLKHVV